MTQTGAPKVPTIKGIFVNSHVKAVRDAKGEVGLALLEQKIGHPTNFKNSQDVPVAEEIRLIECALDVLQPNIPPEQRAFEAGRLHFRNFSTTPLGRVLMSAFPDPKPILLRSRYVAEHVFRGITFDTQDQGDGTIRIILTGGQYPLDHFRGLFWQWLKQGGYEPTIAARQIGSEQYEYLITFGSRV